MNKNQDATIDAITEMQQEINTNINTNNEMSKRRDMANMLVQGGALEGRKVNITTPDPVNLQYVYDFDSIFANQGQAGMFASPYGKSRQTQPTNDTNNTNANLLKTIGGS